MATMLPTLISPEIKSNAERKIFEWFRDAPNTDNWVVLHSLGISNHRRLIYGEIDFLVLAPKVGFFALEVKGGRVRRTNGIWAFTDRYGSTNYKERGPFDQARDGIYSVMSSLKDRLDYRHIHLSATLFGFGVMFPDIEYTTEGIDEEQFQVFDLNNQHNVRNYLLNLSKSTKKKLEDKFGEHFLINMPTNGDVNYVKNLLRGDFDFAISIAIRFNNAEDSLLRLTNEQYGCLDQLEDNPRCLIQGPAGTGKTLLALEAAKRAVVNGERVALFCYNKNLGDWLKLYFSNLPEVLQPAYVGTLHRYMGDSLKEGNIYLPINVSPNYFEIELPNRFIEMMMEEEPLFDRIIIDEAQDLISAEYLDVFDLCLKNGLLRGVWSIFGDFSMQAIYSSKLKGDDLKSLINERSHYISFKLTLNCRNTKPIIEEIRVVADLKQGVYADRNIQGPPVYYYIYSSEEDQQKKLNEIIKSLLDNRIRERDITILSPRRRQDSVIAAFNNYKIIDFNFRNFDNLTFNTIQGFKGLENSVIILTDINTFQDKKLMYVALSRARSGLYILESEEASKEYMNLQNRRIFSDD